MTLGTAAIARGLDPHGALYQRRACKALPLLVRQARAGQTICYGDLAAEMGMPNERNLNFVPGSVGTSLVKLGNEWGEVIPPLQGLVVNRATGMPGIGFDQALIDHGLLAGASKRTRKQIIDGMLSKVFAYEKWPAVLAHFGLEPAAPLGHLVALAAAHQGTGESERHRALKQHVANNPELVGVKAQVKETLVEHRLPSGDTVDVLFRTSRGETAVEVKSVISPEADIARGVFQCVKYEAILNAAAKANGSDSNVEVILALGGELTPATRALANSLGVSVLEKLGTPPQPT